MFNIEKAIRIAKYSKMIYKGYSDMHDALFGIEWQYFEREDTQAMIVVDRDNKELYVIFRGTSSFEDWITDAKCKRIETVFGGVHKGVFEAYQAVMADIEGFVAKIFAENKGYAIWIGGHSLGGGLATWCANRISVTVGTKAIAGVYTFGSMKVFDKDGYWKYNHALGPQTYRIVHGCDMIPYHPYGWQGFGHVDDLVYIDTKDNILVDEDGSKEGLKRMRWDKFCEGVKNACKFRLFREGHEMGRYIEALEQGKAIV